MIVALAGGVGASKFLLGLKHVLPPEEITIIGNTGDDIELHGLRICPDLDTVTYTLCGIVNTETGWGIAGDTFHCSHQLNSYNIPSWFKLGDRDLATHIYRTFLLRQGLSLTEATVKIGAVLDVRCHVLPMTDGYHPTYLKTNRGTIHLQEYLIREGSDPEVQEMQYRDIHQATLSDVAREAIIGARAIILCPSNPLISIGPILAVPGMKECLQLSSAPVIAITPIVKGGALKGPAAKMLKQLGHEVSAAGVARMYVDLLDCFVLDQVDESCKEEIASLGMEVETMNTLMKTLDDKIALARWVVQLL